MVEFSEQAIADLEEIERWIALDDPRLAAKKSAMLADLCELLDAVPGMGAIYAGSLRQFTKESWVILYRPTESGVYVHRVFDTRRDWRSRLT